MKEGEGKDGEKGKVKKWKFKTRER